MFSFWKKKKLDSDIDIEALRELVKEGDKTAQYLLGLAYYRGTSVKKDVEKANYWLGKANEK